MGEHHWYCGIDGLQLSLVIPLGGGLLKVLDAVLTSLVESGDKRALSCVQWRNSTGFD